MPDRPGKVYLIGAGPGAPDLLTLRAVRALGETDVVLVDDLVNREVLGYARADARVIEVGKRAGCKSTPQAFIQRLMARCARQGRIVARLKGGDPFVFGRGGEELLFLRARGIEVEVVSGLTAGVAVPATLGLPVTHRDVARGVAFVTGHTRDGSEPDWEALARSGLTLVIYMGLARLEGIARRLMAAGLSPATPAAVIAEGTLPRQRQAIASLQDIATRAAGLPAPALIVVGEVVALAKDNVTAAVLQAAA